MKLTRLEMETQFLTNERDSTIEVYTCNSKLRNRLLYLSERYPEMYRHKATDQYGGESFVIPKKSVIYKFKEPLSETKQAVINERMAKLRQNLPVKQSNF